MLGMDLKEHSVAWRHFQHQMVVDVAIDMLRKRYEEDSLLGWYSVELFPPK